MLGRSHQIFKPVAELFGTEQITPVLVGHQLVHSHQHKSEDQSDGLKNNLIPRETIFISKYFSILKSKF